MAELVKILCVRFPQWAVERLRVVAKKEGRSMTQLVRWVVEEYLKEYKS